jgi:DNA topoisomerase-3
MTDVRTFQEMEEYASSITNELLQNFHCPRNLPQLICPKCETQQLIIRDKID